MKPFCAFMEMLQQLHNQIVQIQCCIKKMIIQAFFITQSTQGGPNLSRILYGSLKCFSFLYSTSGSKELYISIEVEEGIQCLSLASITVGLGVG